MDVITANPHQLVIRHRRLEMALVLAIFTLLSGLMVINLLLGGIQQWHTLNPLERIAWAVWFVVALVCTGGGTLLWNSARHGITCTFNRTDESCIIRRARRLRVEETHHAIYSVSHIATEHNTEMQMLGLFIVLRSGERIPLATVPEQEADYARDVVARARAFLRGAAEE